jgi:tetratricopeptide (TPR) repeat protein
MSVLRCCRDLPLLVVVALGVSSGAAAATTDDAAAVCTRQLQVIGRALAAYQRDRGELPPHLSDLHPKYVADKRLFHCPADPSPGKPGYAGAATDPGMPISYLYEMSLAKNAAGFMLGPGPQGDSATWRDVKMAQRQYFGDRVPVARCWHHAAAAPAGGEPLTLNLTLAGRVYRSGPSWEFDPGTLPVVLDRLERDLAAGRERFRARWTPDRIAIYAVQAVRTGPQAPPTPAGLRDRLRRVASKLETASATDADFRLAIASFYRAAGETQKAIAGYEAVVSQKGSPGMAVALLAELYGASGRHQKAITFLEERLAQEPKNSGIMDLLATAYEGAGQPDRAAEWRRKADPGGQLAGHAAPEIALKDPAGKEVRLSDLRGKVVFLNFWASW